MNSELFTEQSRRARAEAQLKELKLQLVEWQIYIAGLKAVVEAGDVLADFQWVDRLWMDKARKYRKARSALRKLEKEVGDD